MMSLLADELQFLVDIYVRHQILLESDSWLSNAICLTYYYHYIFFMNYTHQIVQLFDMIAKFSEAGITWSCCSEEAITTFYTFVHLVLLKQIERG